jgi:hypothetical protein
MTISTYIGIKGLLLSILGQVRLSFCKKTLGIDGTACQTLGAIAGTPWAVKGVFLFCAENNTKNTYFLSAARGHRGHFGYVSTFWLAQGQLHQCGRCAWGLGVLVARRIADFHGTCSGIPFVAWKLAGIVPTASLPSESQVSRCAAEGDAWCRLRRRTCSWRGSTQARWRPSPRQDP